MRSFVLALCVLTVMVLAAPTVEAAYQVGDAVGDFTLNDATGTPVSLYDYQGKVVWITFWRFG